MTVNTSDRLSPSSAELRFTSRAGTGVQRSSPAQAPPFVVDRLGLLFICGFHSIHAQQPTLMSRRDFRKILFPSWRVCAKCFLKTCIMFLREFQDIRLPLFATLFPDILNLFERFIDV